MDSDDSGDDDVNPFGSELESTIEINQPESKSPGSERTESGGRLVEKPEKTRDTTRAKSGLPSADDWQDFIGRVVLTHILEGYVALRLRDVELSDRELQSIFLSREDIAAIAAPLASFTSKTDFAKKHGRQIIASADSVEAVIRLSIWMRRVNRIAAAHAPEKTHKRAERAAQKHIAKQPHTHSAMPQRSEPSPAADYQQATFQPENSELDTRALHERIAANGSVGATATEGLWKPPPPGFPIANNGSG